MKGFISYAHDDVDLVTDLPLDLHRELSQIVTTVAGLAQCFPSAEALDAAAHALSTNPLLFAPAALVIAAAREEDLITVEAAASLAATVSIAERGGAQAEKARRYVINGAMSLIKRAGRLVAANLLVGAIASGYAEQSQLMHRIGRAIARAEASVIDLATGLPSKLAQAVGNMVRRASRPNFPFGDDGAAGSVSPILSLQALPDDFLDQAHRMILRGDAPPIEWRPFIVALDFGPGGAPGLERGLLTNISALAGLTALEHLDLTATQVADLSALANLKALQSLNLTNTPVFDAISLAGPTGLQALDLRNTRVTNITPLADIVGLTITMPDGSEAKTGPAPLGEFRLGFNKLA